MLKYRYVDKWSQTFGAWCIYDIMCHAVHMCTHRVDWLAAGPGHHSGDEDEHLRSRKMAYSIMESLTHNTEGALMTDSFITILLYHYYYHYYKQLQMMDGFYSI